MAGFDAAPTAIAQACERAGARGVEVGFLLADATRLTGIEQRFSTVLDSALYHCLGDQERADYAAALHRVTQPGAHLSRSRSGSSTRCAARSVRSCDETDGVRRERCYR